MASSRITRAENETSCLNKNRHIVLVRVVITVMPLGKKWLFGLCFYNTVHYHSKSGQELKQGGREPGEGS